MEAKRQRIVDLSNTQVALERKAEMVKVNMSKVCLVLERYEVSGRVGVLQSKAGKTSHKDKGNLLISVKAAWDTLDPACIGKTCLTDLAWRRR